MAQSEANGLSEAEELELLELIEADEQSGQETSFEMPSPGEAVDKAKETYFEGFDVPPVVQNVAKVAETGIRAGRALGVAAGEATRGVGLPSIAGALNPAGMGLALNASQISQMGQNIPGAADRAKAAFSPSFVPEDGRESTFADLGEIGATLVQTYPILAAGSKHPAVTGGLTFGAMEAIKQAAREGRIVPDKVVKEGALAAALPAIIPATQYVSTGVKNLLKGLFSKTAEVPEKAIDIALDNLKLLDEFSGLGDDVRKGAIEMQEAVIRSRKNAGQVLEKVQKRLGVWKDPKAPIAKTVEKSADVLDAEFRQLTEEVLPAIADPKAKLKLAYDIRKSFKGLLEAPKPGTTLPPINSEQSKQVMDRINTLNTMIEQYGGKRLRLAEQGFSSVAKVYDELQTAMSTPGKAEQLLERIFKGENLDDMIGSRKTVMDLLKKLEKKEGANIVDPLFKQFAARSFKSFEPKGFSGSILAGIAAVLAILQRPGLAAGAAAISTPRGAFEIIKRSKQAGEVVKKGAEVIAKPATRSLIGGQQLFGGTEEEE